MCPFISNALEYGEQDYTLDQIKVYLANGNWALIIAVNEIEEVAGACTVTFINYPNDRVAFVTSIGGRLISDKDTYTQFKTILKTFGATKIQGAVRKSIARLWHRLGFKERYITVEDRI